ncbi:hypothetical protein ACGFY4_12420, partial [Streptomyces sp. NPDC048386]
LSPPPARRPAAAPGRPLHPHPRPPPPPGPRPRPPPPPPRDSALELQVKAALASDLRVEQDLSRWFPVWGAPGL